jgi:hypothetical protein
VKTKIFIFATLILFFSCSQRNSPCIITFDKIKQSDPSHILINQSVNKIADKSFAATRTGGYYIFYNNGLMKSYGFFISKDTSYYKKNKSNKAIEGKMTNYLYSLSSYAEHYDSTGKLKDVFGNPLVYKEIELLKNGRASVTLHFYSFNKFYDNINVSTNSGNTFQLTVTKDNSYSNMMKTSFSYNLRGVKEIKIYIQTNFLDCNNERQDLMDSILINSAVTTQ